MEALAPYGALFLSAFLAATLLPAQSELVLVGLIAAGRGDPILLLIVGTIGNTAGSVVNWALGTGVSSLLENGWFPVWPTNVRVGSSAAMASGRFYSPGCHSWVTP
jgi:membrane protein YqaA with SNARE-associated domain